MCGIAGILNLNDKVRVSTDLLKRMISAIKHRGPDEFGSYKDADVGFAHARLSIIDLSGGQQPMSNEDGTVWITFNGEIFNYVELRQELLKRGHAFSTQSDTEVIIHLYEEYGEGCLEYLNGQFAFAIWNKKSKELFLARDRAGIRPLFYTQNRGRFYFASEIKALFATGEVPREIDPVSVDQIFTIWCTVPPATVFKGINELPPAHYLVVQNGKVLIRKYWDLDFSDSLNGISFEEAKERLRELLTDATRLQLRADVPVGAYLSGGLDSSVTTALIRQLNQAPLMTFSVAFEDKDYDESPYQREMANALGVEHHEVRCKYSDIGDNFPEVIWHTEKPVLRTAPAPLFLLAKLVRDNGLKVVLTGEGADEVLGGYDIFKETKIRQFCARYPESRRRPLLLKKLYPYLPAFQTQSSVYKEAFFSGGVSDISDPLFSHRPRWKTTSMTKLFFSEELKERSGKESAEDSLLATMCGGFNAWPPVARAQYLETKNLLPGYILSSQGDRVAMAHSIEGRFPFLDHRVMEFCAGLPLHYKIRGLNEKYILKEAMKDLLPPAIVKRSKQPYLAPDSKSFFFHGATPDYVEELLSDESIRKYGYFNPQAVRLLINKCKKGAVIGFKDNMAMVGILSLQLTHRLFIEKFETMLSNKCDNMNIHQQEDKWNWQR